MRVSSVPLSPPVIKGAAAPTENPVQLAYTTSAR